MSESNFFSRALARELNAVVMFIDIDGFSRNLGNKESETIFSELRSCLCHISEIIKSHGGFVNKTLGNGLLCYFAADNEQPTEDNRAPLMSLVEAALRSAIEIQQASVLEFIQGQTDAHLRAEKKWPGLPLRIGLHAGKVYWGNGSINPAEPDYTIVGDTVNLAKRLEGSADVFKVLVSPSVKALHDDSSLPLDLGLGVIWGRRFLQIKHQTGVFEAWECNPFGANPDHLKGALRLMRTGSRRASTRIPWLCDIPLNGVLSSGQTARVVDFSENGFCLELESPFARKEQLELKLVTGRSDWNKRLELNGLGRIACDVRWIEKIGTMYCHGVVFTGLPHEQGRALSDLLIQFNNRSHEKI